MTDEELAVIRRDAGRGTATTPRDTLALLAEIDRLQKINDVLADHLQASAYADVDRLRAEFEMP